MSDAFHLLYVLAMLALGVALTIIIPIVCYHVLIFLWTVVEFIVCTPEPQEKD